MSETIENQMLDALEVFHYEAKFRNELFVIASEEKVALHKIITDLRVLHASDIRVLFLCHYQESLQQELETWSNRGTKFKYFFSALEEPLSSVQLEEIEENLGNNIIPVVALEESKGTKLIKRKFETQAIEAAEKLGAAKVFFLTIHRGLEVDGIFQSNPEPNQIKEFLNGNHKINIGKEELKFITDENRKRGIEIVLLPGESGSLFQEIFTHRGKGTLFTQDYPNFVQRGQLKDVTDISLLMKPYISSGALLPTDEDQIAKDIDTYFVYTINGAIIASARIVDYGRYAELAKFCTLPRYRGKGRAKILAQKLIEECKKQGKEYVFALSIEEKMWAFFENLGFSEVPRESLPEKWQKHYDFARPSKALKLILNTD
ncbi:MAG: GNAT family N-acetyltransferase [Proteobacteria bacterium]|nr:GNAT family N-acetyltransferase [Pseudomonadota bacterium]